MPQRAPIPHQLNAARGCVDKTEVQSLWRHRGAAPQGLSEKSKDAAPTPQSRARRPRAVSVVRAPAVAAMHGPEIPDHGPEIQDSNDHEPEIQDPGHPEPDVPEPEIPEPEVPEPEPEHPPAGTSN
jgi:hypothetical protein